MRSDISLCKKATAELLDSANFLQKKAIALQREALECQKYVIKTLHDLALQPVPSLDNPSVTFLANFIKLQQNAIGSKIGSIINRSVSIFTSLDITSPELYKLQNDAIELNESVTILEKNSRTLRREFNLLALYAQVPENYMSVDNKISHMHRHLNNINVLRSKIFSIPIIDEISSPQPYNQNPSSVTLPDETHGFTERERERRIERPEEELIIPCKRMCISGNPETQSGRTSPTSIRISTPPPSPRSTVSSPTWSSLM